MVSFLILHAEVCLIEITTITCVLLVHPFTFLSSVWERRFSLTRLIKFFSLECQSRLKSFEELDFDLLLFLLNF